MKTYMSLTTLELIENAAAAKRAGDLAGLAAWGRLLHRKALKVGLGMSLEQAAVEIERRAA